MIALRATIEADLATTLEGEFASVDALGVGLVTLISPDGVVYAGLKAQVLYDYRRVDPTTGQVVITPEPVVTLRRSSLARIPLADEKWEVRMPISPVAGAPIVSFLLGAGRAPEGGNTLGIIRLYPQALSASPKTVTGAGGIASAFAAGSPVVVPV